MVMTELIKVICSNAVPKFKNSAWKDSITKDVYFWYGLIKQAPPTGSKVLVCCCILTSSWRQIEARSCITLNNKTKILYSILCLTAIQWSPWRIGEILTSYLFWHEMIQAALFCRHCNLSSCWKERPRNREWQ